MGGRVTGWRSLPSQATGRLYLLVATCTAFGNLGCICPQVHSSWTCTRCSVSATRGHIVRLSIYPSIYPSVCLSCARSRLEQTFWISFFLLATNRESVGARRSKIVDFIVEGIGFNLKWNFDNSCVPFSPTTRNGSLFPTWRWSRFPPPLTNDFRITPRKK